MDKNAGVTKMGLYFRIMPLKIINIALLMFLITSCSRNRVTDESLTVLHKLKSRDVMLPAPAPGDWLYYNKEGGQSFEQYTAASPLIPSATRKILYIQPIGKFTPEQTSLTNALAEYLGIFFGLQTTVSAPWDDSVIPGSARRMSAEGQKQLLTTCIMDELDKAMPEDAFVRLAVTAHDLYPSAQFNFVFGQARLKSRVGVVSFNRFTVSSADTANDFRVCLSRLIKTASHETGHMLSCRHCTNAVCVMNGSNSLYESDSRPNRLCSECHQKLYWNLAFDYRRRLQLLEEYFEKHQLDTDQEVTARDRAVIEKS